MPSANEIEHLYPKIVLNGELKRQSVFTNYKQSESMGNTQISGNVSMRISSPRKNTLVEHMTTAATTKTSGMPAPPSFSSNFHKGRIIRPSPVGRKMGTTATAGNKFASNSTSVKSLEMKLGGAFMGGH